MLEVDKLDQIKLVESETQSLLEWARSVTNSKASYFERDRQLAMALGAHCWDNGLTQVGFWVPGLTGEVIQTERDIYLEVFTPLDPIDFRAAEQRISFRRELIELPLQGEFVWGVLSGMQLGTREQAGSFYWVRYHDNVFDETRIIRDVLAHSLPYGIFAPAELYDMKRLQQQRADQAYFQNRGIPAAHCEGSDEPLPRVSAPTNILQIHIGTASLEGTLEGLTTIYQQISDKLTAQQPLTPAEENYVGYDALQLLPIEPPIEYRLEEYNGEHEFFAIAAEIMDKADLSQSGEHIPVTLRKANTQNWGYDVPILGSAATNPAILGSLRPDELVDFVATLHNFSQGPIQLIYDLVYGHADNQAVDLISRQFLKGPNMYGQDLNHQIPMVRAIMLEMQRRKLNSGADGIRIDGGQDFRFFNPLSGRVEQDDAYLLAMSDVVQEINGYQRLLFTIFEDGRPWPEPGWEENSTYRDLIELRPESYQWGPLIFAHNTPTLKGFWDRKWRRVCEVMFLGDRWITGCANHDTVRRGNQVDPDRGVNWNLGETLPQVLRNAYDNPGTSLLVYGFMPGLPMDFLNALMHSPWGFFRNTDERYGVKVVSEEIGFLDWQISPELYEQADTFLQLKALGFEHLELLQRFTKALATAMTETDYDLEAVAQICQHCLGGKDGTCEVELLGELNQPDKPEFLANLDVPKLNVFARAFMEDGHEACRVSHSATDVQPERSKFNLSLRQFRRSHPWLGHNLTGTDRFNRISDEQSTLFYGLRAAPHSDDGHPPQHLAIVVHMGGVPTTVTLGDWLQLDLSQWRVSIATPGLKVNSTEEDLRSFELRDAQGLLLEEKGSGEA